MQFSIRVFLGIMVSMGVAFAVLFTLPNSISVPLLAVTAVMLTASLAGGAFYGRKYTRAFCIGGLFPSGYLCYTFAWLSAYVVIDSPGYVESVEIWSDFCEKVSMSLKFHSVLAWTLVLLSGWMVVAIRFAAQTDTATD